MYQLVRKIYKNHEIRKSEIIATFNDSAYGKSAMQTFANADMECVDDEDWYTFGYGYEYILENIDNGEYWITLPMFDNYGWFLNVEVRYHSGKYYAEPTYEERSGC